MLKLGGVVQHINIIIFERVFIDCLFYRRFEADMANQSTCLALMKSMAKAQGFQSLLYSRHPSSRFFPELGFTVNYVYVYLYLHLDLQLKDMKMTMCRYHVLSSSIFHKSPYSFFVLENSEDYLWY